MASGPVSEGDETAAPDQALRRALGLHGYGQALLAAVPGAAVFVVDRDLRIAVAEGDELERLGLDRGTLEGRVLPDVLPAPSWARLRPYYEGALAGEAGALELFALGTLYAVRVTPLLDAGGTTVGAVAVSRSVTEERRLASVVTAQDATARDTKRLLATAFDRAPVGMSIVGLDGGWLRINDAYCRMLGYTREELMGKTFREVTHPEDVDQDIEWTRRAANGETDSLEREKRYVARDGSVVWVLARSEIVRDDDGLPAYSITLLQNITRRRSADIALRTSERRLRSILDNTPQAVSVQARDHRYELVNHAFEERFDLEPGWIVGRRDDELLLPSVLAVDRESHDEVLRTGALVEQEEVVPSSNGEDRIFLTTKFPLRDASGAISAVCGIYNDITERKRQEDELRDRLEWTAAIHDAVVHERLVLHAQPIVNLATGAVEQAELLVRMRDRRDPTRLVSPGVFVPAAERFDLVGVVDRWVVARAIELAHDHRVEVNLSGRTISDPELVAEIERLVATGGAPTENIIFEITETAVAENLDSARRFAERLRAMGCSFALDDFGVGFGTFTYLKHLPVDYLKIDIEFVRDFVDDEANRQCVHAMVGVAHDFGIKTIAEGVEDQETLEHLALIGVDYAQGYWIGRPAPIEDLWPIHPDPARTAP